MSTTGWSTGPNCRFGLSYFGSTPLEALKLPSTHISSLKGPRSTTTRMLESAAFHWSARAAVESMPSLSLPFAPPVLLYCAYTLQDVRVRQ